MIVTKRVEGGKQFWVHEINDDFRLMVRRAFYKLHRLQILGGSPLVGARQPDFVRARCLLWDVSKVRRFVAVELDIAQKSLG
jgi:hypothetical protein